MNRTRQTYPCFTTNYSLCASAFLRSTSKLEKVEVLQRAFEHRKGTSYSFMSPH